MPTDKQHRLYPPLLTAARELRQPQTPAEAKLCIEIDGDSHAEPDQIKYDQARTEYLNERGYTVIRFTNREVFKQLDAVLQAIADECLRLNPPSPGLLRSTP